MPQCRKCKKDLIWKQPYHPGDRPVEETGKMHFCGPKKRYTGVDEAWGKRWDTIYKFKVPIWCNVCNKHYPRLAICRHIIEDGFIEGKDTVEFYGDKWSAVQRRKNIRADRHRKAEKAK